MADFHVFNNNHKKWKDSLETQAVYIYAILKFTEQPKILGIIFKNMTCSEGDQPLAGDFHVIMDKID